MFSIYYAPVDLSVVDPGFYGLAEEYEDVRVAIVKRLMIMEWIMQGGNSVFTNHYCFAAVVLEKE